MAARLRTLWSKDWERILVRDKQVAAKLDQAAAIVEQGMKSRCPVSKDGSHGRPSGYLRNSIEREWKLSGFKPYVFVGPTAKTPDGKPYAMFVEYPTRPHVIESHGPWPLRDKYGNVFGRVVHHPGTEAQPFMRPAIDDLRGRRL